MRRVIFLTAFGVFLSNPCLGKKSQNESYTRSYKALRVSDWNAPFCEEPADLNVSQEYFVPLGNDVPGLPLYNYIIRLRNAREWNRFDESVTQFKKSFESSPLNDVLAYLEAESLWERAARIDTDAAWKEAEQKLREAWLRYPKSNFSAVVMVSAANILLQKGVYDKSLTLFEKARSEFPLHTLSCVFQMGIGENYFLLKNFPQAERSFSQLLQKCHNAHLRLGAALRRFEIASISKKNAEISYPSNFLRKNEKEFEKHFPYVLHVLAEQWYQRGFYDKAEYYADRYLTLSPKSARCRHSARIRLADTLLRKKGPTDDVVGRYLMVHDEVPESDLGRYARAVALLVELNPADESEFQRRLKLIDENLSRIQDPRIAQQGYLKKGLLLLELGERSAFSYLLHLKDRAPELFKLSAVRDFIREHAVAGMNTPKRAVAGEATDPSDGNTQLRELQAIHQSWLANSPSDADARLTYSKNFYDFLDKAWSRGEFERGWSAVEEWFQSSIAPQAKSRKQAKETIFGIWMRSAYTSEKLTPAAEFLKNQMSRLEKFDSNHRFCYQKFVSAEYGLDWKWKKLEIEEFLSKCRMPGVPSGLSPFVQFYQARVLNAAGASVMSENKLSKIHDPGLATQVFQRRLESLEKLGRYREAIALALKTQDKKTKASPKKHLQQAADWIARGKVWQDAPRVLEAASLSGLSEDELAPFQLLAGKAYFEKRQYRAASEVLAKGLLHDTKSPQALEARYKLGKCWMNLKKPTLAHQVWKELAAERDPFWSPLARNELKLTRK